MTAPRVSASRPSVLLTRVYLRADHDTAHGVVRALSAVVGEPFDPLFVTSAGTLRSMVRIHTVAVEIRVGDPLDARLEIAVGDLAAARDRLAEARFDPVGDLDGGGFTVSIGGIRIDVRGRHSGLSAAVEAGEYSLREEQ